MVNSAEVLALIPARGGSKSIPHKNLREFAGHPLLVFSVAAGQEAVGVSRVLLTTDNEEIAEVGRSYGAEVPFTRPAHLAQDDTLDLPVFQHALEWLEREEGYQPDVVVQLRPTSPVRPPGLVDEAIELLLAEAEADSVRGVVASGQNPYKMWRMAEGGQLTPLLDDGPSEAYNRPRQELPSTYWQTGHIDALRPSGTLARDSMSGEVILGLQIDPRYAVDIDTEADWRRAEELALAGGLDMVWPGRAPRPLPETVELLVLDFDGVLTDNRVWVNAEGQEWVAAHRGDGWGLARLREAGIEVIVLSTETDPVVAARCEKLGLPVEQGVQDKSPALRAILEQHGVDPSRAIFVGNDENDVPCFPIVASALVPADAHRSARRQADRVLNHRGGRGAVREVCDLLLERTEKGNE